MMSQNRQSAKDRLRADLDYKAELDVAQLRRRLDHLYAAMQAQFARLERTAGPPPASPPRDER